MSKSKGPSPSAPSAECVQVVIRCRPLSDTEKANGNKVIVEMDKKNKQVIVSPPASKSSGSSSSSTAVADGARQFTFDNVFGMSTQQEEIYTATCSPLVDSVLSGYNGTIFAYGQTGTGKTHTMEGADGEQLKGMTPRAFDQIFKKIDSSTETQWACSGCFLEIYNDDVLDLLGDPAAKLDVRENPDKGVYVEGLHTVVVKSMKDLNDLLQKGKKNRKVGSTNMNRTSSRSHCIFTVQIENSMVDEKGESHIRVGKLNLVDLAGSERQAKTGAEGDRLKEAAKINWALTALGNVIAALTSSKAGAFIPYRDSKLTRLLQDSLGGNTKTVMCANIGPADYNHEETVNTLRFANRAKNIKNKPKINEDPKDAMLREFQSEIELLRAQLAAQEALERGEPIPDEIRMKLANAPKTSTVMGASQKVIVNKVVEKVINKGITEEELRKVEEEADALKAKIAAAHDEEKAKLLQQEEELKRKQQEMADALNMTKEELEHRRQDRMSLKAKLKAVEAKLLVGKKILDAAEKAERELQQKKEALIIAERERERVQEALRAREQEQLDLAEKYELLDKDVAAKTAKLNQLLSKYQEVKHDIEDEQSAHQREREEILETARELQREIALHDFILDNFVPAEEWEKVELRAEWDDDNDVWRLNETDYEVLNQKIQRPPAVRHKASRPQTEWSRMKAVVQRDPNPRYKVDNVLTMELDMPDRTTQDLHELQQMVRDQQSGHGGSNKKIELNLMAMNLSSAHKNAHIDVAALRAQQQQQIGGSSGGEYEIDRDSDPNGGSNMLSSSSSSRPRTTRKDLNPSSNGRKY